MPEITQEVIQTGGGRNDGMCEYIETPLTTNFLSFKKNGYYHLNRTNLFKKYFKYGNF
jgi:hypothetical protein